MRKHCILFTIPTFQMMQKILPNNTVYFCHSISITGNGKINDVILFSPLINNQVPPPHSMKPETYLILLNPQALDNQLLFTYIRELFKKRKHKSGLTKG